MFFKTLHSRDVASPKLSLSASFHNKPIMVSAISLALFALGFTTQAQIVLSEYGVAVTENFDSIGTTGTGGLLPTYWRADRWQSASAPYIVRHLGTYAEAGTTTTRRGGNDYSNSAGIVNFGAGPEGSATDRAIGFHSTANATTGTNSGNLYAQFVNQTGAPLTAVNLSYDIEKYKQGINPAGFRLELYYSLDGSNWTAPPGDGFYNYFAPDNNNNGYTSAPGETVLVNGTLTFTTPIAEGEFFYLAWNYSVASGDDSVGNAQALAIDNFSIVAIPEPAAGMMLLGGLGILALFRHTRRRRASATDPRRIPARV